jgi:hypothetical protein
MMIHTARTNDTTIGITIGAMLDPVITYLYFGGLVSAMPLRRAT